MSEGADPAINYAPAYTEVEAALPAKQDGADLMDYMLSGVLCIVCFIASAAIGTGVFNWFAVPCFFCGFIMGADVIAWLRGHLDTFDPRAMSALVGFHLFYFSALIFVASNMQMLFVINPDNWPHWVGIMGFLNALGMIFYKLGVKWGMSGRQYSKTILIPASHSFPVMVGFIMAGALCQIAILISFGGFRGLIATKEQVGAMGGWGIPRLLAGSLPLLAFLLLSMLRMNKTRTRGNNMTVMIMLGGIVFMQLLITGYSGSRGQIVFPAFWILLLVHHLWRPLKPKFFIFLVIASIPLMTIYGFYKTRGAGALHIWKTTGSIGALMENTKRTPAGVLIGDFSRVDVHAYIAYKLIDQPESYRLRKGETFLFSWASIVPRWIWRNRPADVPKVEAGTELFYGAGYYKPFTRYRSTRAYGLTGETMLNFGLWPVPLVFILWGLFVGRLTRYLKNREPMDMRILILPYMVWMSFNILVWDFDNHIAHTFTRSLVVLLVLFVCLKKVPNPRLQEAA